MNLPGVERAVIPEEKVRGYLLSHDHAIGRHKAHVFEALGFTGANWALFATAIRTLAETGNAVPAGAGFYGQKYRVTGWIAGPSGQTRPITTIWVVAASEDFPRLVTAYPAEAE